MKKSETSDLNFKLEIDKNNSESHENEKLSNSLETVKFGKIIPDDSKKGQYVGSDEVLVVEFVSMASGTPSVINRFYVPNPMKVAINGVGTSTAQFRILH